MHQQTLVLIKPDAVGNQVWFDIMVTYRGNFLGICEAKLFTPLPLETARELYREHEGKDFYWDLLSYMTHGTVIALWITGENAVQRVRELNGATKPSEAEDGTIRKLYGTDGCKNAVHGSANPADAERELKLIFGGVQTASQGGGSL